MGVYKRMKPDYEFKSGPAAKKAADQNPRTTKHFDRWIITFKHPRLGDYIWTTKGGLKPGAKMWGGTRPQEYASKSEAEAEIRKIVINHIVQYKAGFDDFISGWPGFKKATVGRTAAQRVTTRYLQAAVIGDVFSLPKPGSQVKDVLIAVGQDPTAWVKFKDGSFIVGHVAVEDVATLIGLPVRLLEELDERLLHKNLSLNLHKFGSRVASIESRQDSGQPPRENGCSGCPTPHGEMMHCRVAQRWLRKVAAKKITDKTPIEGFDEYQKVEPTKAVQMDEAFEVETLEGTMKGQKGDYLAEGVDGERWPVKKSIFEKTHKKKAMQRIAQRVAARYIKQG